jgi:hypothetical protein
MTLLKRVSGFGIAAATLMLLGPCLPQSFAQSAPAPKSARRTASRKKGTAAAKQPPLTQADVLKYWNAGDQDLFLKTLELRSLAFEPEEDWVAKLPNPAAQPLAIAALRSRIPLAPSVDDVNSQAPAILAKLRDAAQKRNESDMAPLVHPALLQEKAKVYDLFDIANYRNHSLGRSNPVENRRVGVQFFELTTSQVEKLYYLEFSTYGGHVVLRDVITGQEVATRFLRDEKDLAVSKLDLVFRALNDGDDTGLRNLCTPGLYDSLKARTGEDGGSVLTRGQHVSLNQIQKDASVSLNEKSVRVVVRVSYPTKGKPLQYDVDFERIDKDLKVVRVRDLHGGVIAWDPNIDNYLNRRYGLPDGPPPQNVAETDEPIFIPTKMLVAQAMRALESHDAKKLKGCAEEMLAREPSKGEGYALRAASEHMAGDYDKATNDAQRALDHGATVFFDIMLYGTAMGMSHNFSPVILGVSKAKVEFRVPMGGQNEEVASTSIKSAAFEKQGSSWKGMLKDIFDRPGPFLKIEVARQKNKNYRLAAVGTTCPDAQSARDKDLERYPGGACGSAGTAQNPQPIDMLVPHEWFQDLKVVMDTIDYARQSGSGAKK